MSSLEIGALSIVVLGFVFIAIVKYQEKHTPHTH
jgi:hypothetical protein